MAMATHDPINKDTQKSHRDKRQRVILGGNKIAKKTYPCGFANCSGSFSFILDFGD